MPTLHSCAGHGPAVAEPPAPRRLRDHIVDLWRGLALIDMAWVHLVGNRIALPPLVAAVIGEHTRFAAGGFVLLAGVSVAAVHGDALARGGEGARAARRRLWRRALVLAGLDRLLAITMTLLNGERHFLPGGEDPSAPLWPFVGFQEPGVTGGLLLLYALLLGIAPAVAAVARRLGWSIVLGLSLGLYWVAHASGDALHWPPWTFPLAFWQPLFVLGWAASPALRWLRGGGVPRLAIWTGVAVALWAVALWTRHGIHVPGLPAVGPLDWDFGKTPLRPAELVRYLLAMHAVFAGSALAVSASARLRAAAAPLGLLGRHSLTVYVAHLFVEVPIVEWAWGTRPSPWAGCALLVLDAGALVAVAALAERLRAPRPAHDGVSAHVHAWLPRRGLAGTAAALLSVVALAGIQRVVATDAPGSSFRDEAEPPLVGTAGPPLHAMLEDEVEGAPDPPEAGLDATDLPDEVGDIETSA